MSYLLLRTSLTLLFMKSMFAALVALLHSIRWIPRPWSFGMKDLGLSVAQMLGDPTRRSTFGFLASLARKVTRCPWALRYSRKIFAIRTCPPASKKRNRTTRS